MKSALVRRRWSQLSYTGLSLTPQTGNFNISALLNSSITINLVQLTKGNSKTKYPKKNISKPFILDPDQKFFILWHVIAILLIVLQAFVIPWLIVFPQDDSINWDIADILMQSFFTIDIILNFFTAYYRSGELVTDNRSISIKYLKSWFILDLIAIFPYIMIIDLFVDIKAKQYADLAQSLRILKLVRLFNLVRIAKLKAILYQLDNYIQSSTMLTLFTFVRILFFIGMLAHWIACAWAFISFLEQDSFITWRSELISVSSKTIYIRSLYWTITTIITVGYGDYKATNTSESLMNIFIMLTASASFPYVLGQISSLLSKQAEADSIRRKQMIGLNHYMREKQLNQDLKFRARRYCEVVWERNIKNNIKEEEICKLMSDNIRDKIYEYSRGHLLSEYAIFTIFQYSFYMQICAIMRNNFFAPGDRLFQEGEANGAIYFIVSGRAQIYHYKTQTVFKDLNDKEYFGQISFFTDFQRTASALSLNFLETMSILPEDMQNLLDKSPESKQYCQELKQLCKDRDFSALQIACYLCNNIGHVAINCKEMVIQMDSVQNYWIKQRKERRIKQVGIHSKPNFLRTNTSVKITKWLPENIKGSYDPISKYTANPNLLKTVHIYQSMLEKSCSNYSLDWKKSKINDLLFDDIESSNMEDRLSEGPDYRFKY